MSRGVSSVVSSDLCPEEGKPEARKDCKEDKEKEKGEDEEEEGVPKVKESTLENSDIAKL